MPETPPPLLAPEFLARLERLELVSRKIFRGRLKGERLGKRKGQSVEFADFRNYAPGDDLRFLDWNLYARLDRLFLRLFLEEEDLHVNLLIDNSRSMDYGSPTKLRYAKQVVAALGFVGLINMDRVNVTAFDGDLGAATPPLRGRRSVWRLLDFLDKLGPAGPGDLAAAMRRFALTSPGQGVVIVVSDFLDKAGPDDAVRFLTARPVDVHLIQVLSQEEIEPPVTGDLRLIDCEDDDEAEVTVSAPLLKRYRETLAAFRAELSAFCAKRGASYLFTSNQVPFERLVLDYLRRRGLVR